MGGKKKIKYKSKISPPSCWRGGKKQPKEKGKEITLPPQKHLERGESKPWCPSTRPDQEKGKGKGGKTQRNGQKWEKKEKMRGGEVGESQSD